MGVTLKRNVILRAIVTPRLREELQRELGQALEEVEARLQQIDFQTKPYLMELQRTNLQQAIQVRKQIDAEKQKHEDLQQTLEGRKAQVAGLADGDEIIRGTLESSVEVNQGDNLAELLYGTELVVKDDEIVEIRQRPVSELLEGETDLPPVPAEAARRPAIITDLSGGLSGK